MCVWSLDTRCKAINLWTLLQSKKVFTINMAKNMLNKIEWFTGKNNNVYITEPNLFKRHLWQKLMGQGFPFFIFLQETAKSLVFCRHFNVKTKQTKMLSSKQTSKSRNKNKQKLNNTHKVKAKSQRHKTSSSPYNPINQSPYFRTIPTYGFHPQYPVSNNWFNRISYPWHQVSFPAQQICYSV